MFDFQKKLDELKDLRKAESFNKDEIDSLLEAVKQSPDYLRAQEILTNTKQAIAALEAEIKSAGVQAYTETGEKKVFPGVNVKVFKAVKIIDEKAMREWTVKNLPDALVPDTEKLKKYAKEIAPVDGIQITEEPRAEIASKLE